MEITSVWLKKNCLKITIETRTRNDINVKVYYNIMH